MGKLIKGKRYYVSDESIKVAENYKRDQQIDHLFTYIGEGNKFYSERLVIHTTWKYWVAEEEEFVYTDPRTKCAEYVVEATESLIRSCIAVGGIVPNMDMSLKEFLSIYGWNGVGFTVLEGKKKEMER